MTERTEVMTTWTVGQVADLFDVTVRTLHHYDQVGLLEPSERSPAGYRLYTDQDLTRLQQIVVYRRLKMPLEEIARLLHGEEGPVDHLRRQRTTVMARLEELHELITAIDRALEQEMNNQPATNEDIKALFGDGFRDEYQEEAEQRWGQTAAWQQSSQRTKGYSKADWQQIKDEMDAVNAAFVTALQSGEPADSESAMAAAEEHRRQIEAHFYDLDHEFHRNLSELYVTDPRFTQTYESLATGLARYVRDAIHANADRVAASA